ncbi:phosphoribosyltransferase [Methanofollis ethanolicus]|uniref:phosphoribosyltransferase n=1 Tax=Methanofollis ethanolicus TaxID=488124 RepID=UPI00082A8280|nr:phosphoribosyltransferase [Methanofollis ethanolicus]
MIPATFRCEMVGWERAARLSRLLAEKIKASGYRPDVVVAIGRGGYVPARIVCDSLLIGAMTGITIKHWGPGAEKKEEAVIRYPLAADVAGLAVLIVDDVTDTGETLSLATGYVEGFSPREVRTAVLHHKRTSAVLPDYYAGYVGDWRWVTYPWAAHEDLVGFAGKVLPERPATLAEVAAALEERYDIRAGAEELVAALADLVALGEAVQEGPLYRRASP